TRLGKCWLRFFRLPVSIWPVFHVNLLAAAGLHDWGKANDGFQAAVGNRIGKATEQAIRHEHISALLVGLPVVIDWLNQISGLDKELVLSVVLTHHLKARFEATKQYGFGCLEPSTARICFFADHDGFRETVMVIVNRLGTVPFHILK